MHTAIRLDPGDAFSYTCLGYTYQKQNKLDEAFQAYQKAIELDPDQYSVHANLATLYHYDYQRYEDAEIAYRRAIELNPTEPRLLMQYAGLLVVDFHRYSDAEPLLLKAIELDPDIDLAYYNLACIRCMRGETGQALDDLHLAAQKGYDCSEAWEDADLKDLWDDPRFAEIAGDKPTPEATSTQTVPGD